jgi:hypothetical protein
MSGVEAAGEVQAEEQQHLGDVRASDLTTQAAYRRAEGKAARTGSYLKAAATLIGAGAGMYDKYNPPKGAEQAYSAGRDPMRAYLDPTRRTYDYGYM